MPEIKSPDQKSTALTVAFDREKQTLMASLPGAMDRERWANVALSMLKNPTLARCSPESVIAAVYKNARVGLPLDGVHAALVPFGQECTHIVGYPGWVSLYTRHAGVSHVRAKVVFEGDEFTVEEGSEGRLVHKPAPKGNHTDPTKIVAAYAVAHLKAGGSTFVVMWKDELEALQRRCLQKTNGKGPWNTDPIEMMRKSSIIRLRKGLTLTEDVQALMAETERDELVVDVQGGPVDPQKAPTTIAELKESLAPLEPETLPSDARLVRGVRITLDAWDAWAGNPMERVAKGSALEGWTPNRLVEAAGPEQRKEIARLAALGQGQQDPHPTLQKCALVLEQLEPSTITGTISSDEAPL